MSDSLVLLIKAQIGAVLVLCLCSARRHSFPFLTKQAEHFPHVNIVPHLFMLKNIRAPLPRNHSGYVWPNVPQRNQHEVRNFLKAEGGNSRLATMPQLLGKLFYGFYSPISTSHCGCGCTIHLHRSGLWRPLKHRPESKNPKLNLILNRVKKRNHFNCWIWQKSLRESTDYTTEICMN